MNLDAAIEMNRDTYREYCFAMEQRKRSDLALLSLLRSQLGWRKDGDKKANSAAAERAKELVKIGERIEREEAKALAKGKARKEVEGETDPDFLRWRQTIIASVRARTPFDDVETLAEKRMADFPNTLS